MHVKKNIIISLIIVVIAIGLSNCKSNKISCPAYGDNKPPTAMPKGSKTRSGVMPGDGRGTRTRIPQ